MTDEIDTPAEAPVETSVVEAPATLDEAVDRALDTTFDRDRDELGRFKAKDEATDPEPVEEPVAEIPDEFAAPPEWLNAGKDKWGTADQELRKALSARFGEMQQGIQQYRDQMAPFQPFLQSAQASGVDPVALVNRYVEIDRAFTANPLQGFDMIARSLGTDMRTIAAHILGQPAPEKDAQVTQLQRQNAEQLRELQELRGLQQRFQSEQAARVEKTVSDFAAANPRFEELAPAIQGILKAGLAPDLPTAYAYAERLNPAPVPAAAVVPPAAPPAPARNSAPNPKTTLSISGAPTSGSNPGKRGQVMSLDDAISSALSAAR